MGTYNPKPAPVFRMLRFSDWVGLETQNEAVC